MALADVVAVLDVYPARERGEDHPGVSGLLIAEAAADAAGGRPVYWLPSFAEAEPVLRGILGQGDVCLVMGAGDVDALGRRLVGRARRELICLRQRFKEPMTSRNSPATMPVDRAARLSARPHGNGADRRRGRVLRPRRVGRAAEGAARWATTIDAPVTSSGSGSNLLIADEGVSGLVVKLDRKLALIKHEGERIVCGGGARLPSVAARAAQAGLTGIEFGVNIPGTVGGAVRMNANAYGGELAKALEWVEVVTADGAERRAPAELGFGYRHSNLAAGEIVARASFVLTPARTATVKATLAEMRERRHAAQPQGIKTFGSTFKNPERWVRPMARLAPPGCCSPRPVATA